MPDKDWSERIARAMTENRERETREMTRLLQDPSLYNVAQQLTDSLEKALIRLCNYEKVVSNNGHETLILELIQQLQDDLRAEFRRLTGKDYVPPICRAKRDMEANPNHPLGDAKKWDRNAAALLQEIFGGSDNRP